MTDVKKKSPRCYRGLFLNALQFAYLVQPAGMVRRQREAQP